MTQNHDLCLDLRLRYRSIWNLFTVACNFSLLVIIILTSVCIQSHLFQIKRHAMGSPIIDHELALQHIDGLLQYCEQNLDNIEERTLSELNASICLVNIIQSNRPEPCPILEQLKTDMLPIVQHWRYGWMVAPGWLHKASDLPPDSRKPGQSADSKFSSLKNRQVRILLIIKYL